MIFARISVFGENYDIFPMASPPKDPERLLDKRDATVTAAFLLPSAEYDVRVITSGKGGKAYEKYPQLAYAVGIFLTLVRGLPLDEMEIETPAGVYKFFASPDGKREILLQKCKLLYSKKPVTALNTDVKVSCVDTDFGSIRVCECFEAQSFAIETLRALCLCTDGEELRGCVAVSRKGDGYTLHSYFHIFPDLPSLAAASALVCGVDSSGSRFSVIGASPCRLFIRRGSDGYLASCDYPAPLVLYTQDCP